MKKLMTLILVSMIGNGYIECKAQSNADFEEAKKINISNSYSLRVETKINPYSNEKFCICTLETSMPGRKDLICLYNAEDNTIRMLDSFNLRSDVYSRLYLGIDGDTLYFYDYKTRQYYCSEYPFDNATKYNGSRIPIFNRIRDLKLIELKSEYIIHNNQDLIYIDTTSYYIDTTSYLCHYSVLTGKTTKLRKPSDKFEGYMFPFSDDEVLLVTGFLVSNHGDFEELPYIYNYKTNKITEIKLKDVPTLWKFHHYDKSTGKAIVRYDYRLYEATITKQGNKYYLSLTKELFDLRDYDRVVNLNNIYDIFKYKDFYIFKKIGFKETYLKIKKWW